VQGNESGLGVRKSVISAVGGEGGRNSSSGENKIRGLLYIYSCQDPTKGLSF